MLKMKNLNCSYGECKVLHDTSLEVNEGRLVGLIGRNGVGKTTTLKSIMGLVPHKSGSVHFYEVNLSGYHPIKSLAWVLPICLKADISSPN